MREHVDVTIVGGGPVGASLALALAGSGLEVQVLEARASLEQAAWRRTLALSYGSRLILDRLGVWSALRDVTPIRHIHVSQRGSFGVTRLHADEEGVPELGYVVDYGELDAALHAALAAGDVQVVTGTRVTGSGGMSGYAWVEAQQGDQTRMVTARLAVIADGGAGSGSQVTREYGQHALLAWVRCSAPRPGWAFERFTAQGPVALLPQGEGYALVWTEAPERVQALLAMAEPEFLAALHEHFGDRVGEFLQVRERSSFPLVLAWAPDAVSAHRIMIGNAAHVMHPVAGQGFNLGLRDAWELAVQIRATDRQALGSEVMLRRFASMRAFDVSASMWFTDRLVRLFTRADPVLHHARGAGLAILQQFAPFRHFVARRMMFGARAW